MTASSLPVDIWLIIFDHIQIQYDVLDDIDADGLTILWCVIRNVSSYLRDCIDEYFRHGVLQGTLVELRYSNMNHHGGPAFTHLHIAMQFSHLIADDTRAVFGRHHTKIMVVPAYTEALSVAGCPSLSGTLKKYSDQSRT